MIIIIVVFIHPFSFLNVIIIDFLIIESFVLRFVSISNAIIFVSDVIVCICSFVMCVVLRGHHNSVFIRVTFFDIVANVSSIIEFIRHEVVTFFIAC